MKAKRIFWSALIALLIASAAFAYWAEIGRWHVATVEVMMDGEYWRAQRERETRMRAQYPGEVCGRSYISMRMSWWRDEAVMQRALRRYRTGHPSSQSSDEDVLRALREAEIEAFDPVDSATISVRTLDAEFSVAVANAYAQALVDMSEEAAHERIEKGFRQIHHNVEKVRRGVVKMEATDRSSPEYVALTNQLADCIAAEKEARVTCEQYREYLVIKSPAKIAAE